MVYLHFTKVTFGAVLREGTKVEIGRPVKQ